MFISGPGAFLFPQFDYFRNELKLRYGAAIRSSQITTFMVLGGLGWLILGLLQRPALRRSSRYRMARGLCIQCAYDLSGITTGTCPECGNTNSNLSSNRSCEA